MNGSIIVTLAERLEHVYYRTQVRTDEGDAVTVTSAVQTYRVDDAPFGDDHAPVLFEPPRRSATTNGSVPLPVAPVPPVKPARPRRDTVSQGRRTAGPPPPPVPQAAKDLLIDASRGLGRAIRSTTPADRYAAAHLAALRGAAAVLAAKARPVRGRRGSAWELLTKVAPELSEWAAFFAAGSAKRQAAEAGLTRLVAAREADDMLRQVSAFLDLVEDALAPADERRSMAQ